MDAGAAGANAGADAAGAAAGAEEAMATASSSFGVVILVLLACAAVASALVYWQRKRHENYSLLSGLDSRYDELLEKLQEVADEFDAAVDTEPEPSALEKRNALIKRALAVIPLVRVVQQEIQQKQVLYREGKVRPEDFERLHRLKTAIEEETEVVREIAEAINPGFGAKIFPMVASSNHFSLLFMMDNNCKLYQQGLEGNPSIGERKLLLITYRALPCFDFLRQLNSVPVEQLHKDGKISVDEYQCFLGVKHRLEAEKQAVEEEAKAIDPEFKVFHVVMGPQQQLFKMCLEADRIVKQYEGFIEKEDLTPRQRILALILRKGVPLIQFLRNLEGNATQAKAALDEGRLPFDVYEFLISVKERIERKLNDAKEEANVLLPPLGDELESVWERMQPHFKPVLQLEQAADAYNDGPKKDDKAGAQAKLAALVEKRVQPAMKLDKELREAQLALEAKSENSEVDLEIFMAIRERVEEELEEARSEGFALMGPDYDVVEKEEEKAEKRRRGISSSSSGASKPKSEKERLKEKAEARKLLQAQQAAAATTSNDAAGAGGEKKGVEGPEDLARKAKEADRIAAELLAEESKGKKKADTGTSGSGGGKKKKTPKA